MPIKPATRYSSCFHLRSRTPPPAAHPRLRRAGLHTASKRLKTLSSVTASCGVQLHRLSTSVPISLQRHAYKALLLTIRSHMNGQLSFEQVCLHPGMASRKRSHDDMRHSRPPSKGIDQAAYHTYVLQLPPGATEDELDHNLNDKAHELGIVLPHIPAAIDGLASSFFASTLSSDPINQVARLSQSTAPTSCSSSFHRPVTQPSMSQVSVKLPIASNTPSIVYENEKKRGFGFRDGIRRMTGFKKRRSLVVTPELGSINGSTPNVQNADRMSIRSGLKSPASIKSNKSSWSVPQVVPRVYHEEPRQEDQEAATRTRDCQEFKNMRTRQVEEMYRFLGFQRGATTHARLEHQAAKQRMLEAYEQAVRDTMIRVSSVLSITSGRFANTSTRTRRQLKISSHDNSKQKQSSLMSSSLRNGPSWSDCGTWKRMCRTRRLHQHRKPAGQAVTRTSKTSQNAE